MHSFIFNLRETDDKTTYEDYEVAGMFNRADYVEEFPKESRYYKQALEMLKKECHGEIYWGTDITTQKGKLPLRNWSKLISSDWNTKYVKDTLLKLSIKAIEDYRRKIRRKYTDTQIDEKTGFLFINNLGEVENEYYYFGNLLSYLKEKSQKVLNGDGYVYLWVNQVFDYHY